MTTLISFSLPSLLLRCYRCCCCCCRRRRRKRIGNRSTCSARALAHSLTHSLLTHSLTNLKKAPSLLTLPKTSAPAPRASERASAAVACRAVPCRICERLLLSALVLAVLGASVFARFHRVFAGPFPRLKCHAHVPAIVALLPEIEVEEAGVRIPRQSVSQQDALLALRRLSRRVSRRRCSSSRDALEIQRFLPEDRPEVSVAKAVCVTKPKKQREC